MRLSTEDRWLDQLEQWSHSDVSRDRRLSRVIMVGLVGLSYLIDTLLLSLFCLAGTVDLIVPVVYGTAAAGHVILFGSLHWTGYSERFANPHLTVWQMAYAIAVQLVAMTISPQITTFFLAITFLIFGFGTLRISMREALTVWLFACLAISFTLSLFDHSNLGIAFPNSRELVLVGLSFATILLRSISLGYYATVLRGQIRRKANSLEKAMGEVEHLATHDVLTGALNRRVILPAIDERIGLHKRKGIPACVAMLDVDRFKSINDRLGHLVGDAILKNLARQIGGSIRTSDKLARYGGDEFILLLSATSIDEGMKLLERIRGEIASASWGDIPDGTRVTISGGITEISPSDMFLDVTTRADRALYTAKNSGRNRICRYDLISDTDDCEAGAQTTPAEASSVGK